MKDDNVEQENPNEMAGMFAEKYLQGKSYYYVLATASHLKTLAEISCKFPILTKER
jgi:hypothetical protein